PRAPAASPCPPVSLAAARSWLTPFVFSRGRFMLPGYSAQWRTGMNLTPDGGNPYTSGIARFVAGLRYDAIPEAVKERIKLLILDALGCGIFAADLEWSRILLTTLGAVDASKGCGIWGTEARLSAPHAVL